MKPLNILKCALCTLAVGFMSETIALAATSATTGIKVHVNTGETRTAATSGIDSLYFNTSADTLFVVNKSVQYPIAIADVDSISYGSTLSYVHIVYDDDKVYIENPYAFNGVNVDINGAHVVVNSSNSNEIEYKLTGTSANGSFKIYSSKKYQITLNGVSLSNSKGAAINSQSSKNGTIKVQGGTINTLCDAAKYTTTSGEDMKGTIFSEGQLIFKGAGTLNICSLNKHAICSDDYIEIDNSTINVTAAASDAIHANDSVLIYGGKLTLNPSGDGIDCSGLVVINTADTCTLHITCSGDDVKGIKSDSTLVIRSGNIHITTTGIASKAMKSSQNIEISGGCITTTQSGNVFIENGDVSYSTALKADNDIIIDGGTFILTNSAAGGKGLSADGNIDISGGSFNITCSGDGALYDPNYNNSSDTSYKVFVNIPSSGNMGRPQNSSAWSSVYLYKSDGTKVATLNTKVTVSASTGGSATFYYYDFGAATTDTYYFASDNSSSSAGGSSTSYTIQSGTFAGPSDGSNHFYKISSSYTTSGTTRTYSISDVSSSYNSGTISSDGEESYSSAGIKGNGNLSISSGTFTILNTGKGGKGINIDGDATFGTTDGGCPTLNITTQGTVVSSSGNGMNQSLVGQPKAIKAEGDIVINDGNIFVKTSNNGGEGIESKAYLTVNGGYIECDTYDDGINAAKKITVNGGFIYSHATGNDGIDCNGSEGFEFNGGVTIASGASAPEEGFDCDNYTFKINGGILIGTGGATSTPTSASQAYTTKSNVSLTANRYLGVKSNDGTVLFSYKCPKTLSNATILLSSSDFTSGTSYTLVYNATAVNNATATAFDGIYSTGGTLTGGNTTTFNPITK